MFATTIIFALIATLVVQNVECYTHVEIRSQYQPTLLRLRDLANVKLLESDREFKTLAAQLDKHHSRSRNSTQTAINNIKQVLADAKKSPNVTAAVLTCLRNQETQANRLTTTAINACYPSANISALEICKKKFSTLASVATNTNSYCQSLNPLGTQLEPFGRCLADKIPDLNRQINLVETEYQSLSNATLKFNVQCLSQTVGGIMGQISVISYEVNLCFFV